MCYKLFEIPDIKGSKSSKCEKKWDCSENFAVAGNNVISTSNILTINQKI